MHRRAVCRCKVSRQSSTTDHAPGKAVQHGDGVRGQRGQSEGQLSQRLAGCRARRRAHTWAGGFGADSDADEQRHGAREPMMAWWPPRQRYGPLHAIGEVAKHEQPRHRARRAPPAATRPSLVLPRFAHRTPLAGASRLHVPVNRLTFTLLATVAEKASNGLSTQQRAGSMGAQSPFACIQGTTCMHACDQPNFR